MYYEGTMYKNIPHGYGKLTYPPNNRLVSYKGNFFYGELDGIGKLVYRDNSKYCGYFCKNQRSGMGFYENADYAYFGKWSNDKKHGVFWETDKKKHKTYEVIYKDDEKYDLYSEIGYHSPYYMKTKIIESENKKQIITDKCIVCNSRDIDSVNVSCGHLYCCYDCLSKCTACPICRTLCEKIIKIYR